MPRGVFKHPYAGFSDTIDIDSLMHCVRRDYNSNRCLADILEVIILKIEEMEQREIAAAISVRPVKRRKREA